MSWEELNQEVKVDDLWAKQKDEFGKMCFDLFVNNPLGKKFLHWTIDLLKTPVCPRDQEPRYGYFREGQNSIIRQICMAIELHKSKGTPK